MTFSIPAVCQFPQISFATDLGIQRNFRETQEFWTLGHTVHTQFHLNAKNAVYILFAYYTNGKFTNNLTATAKSPLTIPSEINYTNSARMRLKHFSAGWKKYFKGGADAEKGWNLYGYAGFGLLPGRIENTHSVFIDTALYSVPVIGGRANFKRLTLDVGAGWEKPIGGDFFFYAEGRVYIPTTNYPSKFLFANDNAPFVGMLNAGLRIFFN